MTNINFFTGTCFTEILCLTPQIICLYWSPAKLSRYVPIGGILNILPMTGILLKKLIATGKKPLNRTTNPYNSTHIPMRGQPNNTINMPPKKAPLPLALCHWKKNLNVLSRPITQARPDRNKIFPIANNPLSKSKQTPRNRNATPNPARPTPIF